MAASPIAKAIHGATTIRSVPVIRVAPKLPVLSRSVHPVVMRAR
jgi:hypothetical protein